MTDADPGMVPVPDLVNDPEDEGDEEVVDSDEYPTEDEPEDLMVDEP